jgi:hypothetical protein
MATVTMILSSLAISSALRARGIYVSTHRSEGGEGCGPMTLVAVGISSVASVMSAPTNTGNSSFHRAPLAQVGGSPSKGPWISSSGGLEANSVQVVHSVHAWEYAA